MGSIISPGVGSGIDINQLVQQLVAAEGNAKHAQLTAREARLQAKLSAFGSFRSALDKLKTALAPLTDIAKFQGRAVTVGDSKVLSVTASANASPGTFNVEVERLARAHRLASGPYTEESTVVGTGTLRITLAGTSFDTVIDSTNHTLAGIRDAINKAAGSSGVTATIINETGVGARLILSSNKTGAANTISVTESGGDAGLQALVSGLATTQTALDSRIVIDGYPHESATNSVTTAVTGLTFNLLTESAQDVTTPVAVTLDKTAANKAVNDFVSAYNALVNSLKGLSAFDAASGNAGALLGDSTLRDFQFALRRELGVPVTGVSASFSTLAEIGITSKVDGALEVNTTKLDGFLASNFDEVGGLFANASSTEAPVEGLARRLDKLIDTYTTSDGLIDNRTKGLQSSVEDIAEQRTALNRRLGALETRLRAQFTAMDALVAQLNSTSNFLTQQINTLNGSILRAQTRGQ